MYEVGEYVMYNHPSSPLVHLTCLVIEKPAPDIFRLFTAQKSHLFVSKCFVSKISPENLKREVHKFLLTERGNAFVTKKQLHPSG
jgi:hypothetical protein